MGPTPFRHCIRAAVALFVMLVMCSLKLSLSSRVMPKNLADVNSVRGVLLRVPGFASARPHFLSHVNITSFVLRVLTFRSPLLHQFSITLTRESKLSANACR